MRKVFIFVYVILSLFLIACTPSYDVGEFVNAMDYTGHETFDYVDGDGTAHTFSYNYYYSISDTETLYCFGPFISASLNQETPGVFIDEEGYCFVYIIMIDDPDSDVNTARFPTYRELTRIFKDYIEENPITTTCHCECD